MNDLSGYERVRNLVLEEATNFMARRNRKINPTTVGRYIKDRYNHVYTPEEIKSWLEKQDWYDEESENE